ncbi:MAG: pilus assembly PilX N-terminal domain-containing protein [bacterium]|nr:pilus assembly PilX N-terminal domain-containing protein [bacterium]
MFSCLCHNSYFIIPNSSEKGFTLLFAVLVGSLLFSIGIAIAHLALRELVLSAAGKQSETAFFAADTGIECALYFDRVVGKNPLTPVFPNSETAPGDADGFIKCDNDDEVQLTFETPTATAATTTFRMNFPVSDTNPTGSCVDVTVGKVAPQDPAPARAIIEARGRNDSDCGSLLLNPGRVERALRVRY